MDNDDNAEFGTVGFRFQKYFPGHGVFLGMVVEVLPGSGLLRVAYADGDGEDLTARELRALCGEWKRHKAKASAYPSKKTNKAGDCISKKSTCSGGSSCTQLSGNNNKPLEFDQRVIPPIDEAAEATLTWKKEPGGNESSGDGDDENDADADALLQHEFDNALQNTARLLADGGAPSKRKRKRLQALPLNSNSAAVLVPLSCTPCGKRFGVKVFHHKDGHRRVGEILCETGHGVVEVVTVMKDLEKLRVSDLIVAPPGYAIGDCVDSSIPLPCMNGKNKRQSPSKQQQLKPAIVAPSSANGSTTMHTIKKQKQIQRQSTHEDKTKNNNQNSKPTPKTINPKRLASDFYWNCQHCTLKNVYNKVTCKACRASKSTNSCTSSDLLKVAENAARSKRTLDEVVMAVPVDYKDKIPLQVLDALVTCAAMIGSGSNERRCTKPRLPGQDYCYSHRDDTPIVTPLHCGMNHNNSSKKRGINHPGTNMEDESSSTTTMDRESSSDGIACTEDVANDDSNDPNANHNVLESAIILSDDALKQQQQQEESTNQTTPCHEQLATDLQRTDALLTSAKTWHIESIEDAIFCAENDPFPLGMLVRRFFPHWGFHDGTIIKVMRQLLQNQDKKHKSKSKSVRPVLVYRVKYDDGDQEDFTHNEICSLRQIYNQRSIPSTAKPVEQMPIGTIYLCQKDVLVKIDRHSTPRGMKEGEGGTVHVLYSQNGAPWTRTTLELIQLQLNVVCKLPPYYSKWGGNLVEDLEVIDVVEEESDYKKVNDLYEEDPELMAEIRKSRFLKEKQESFDPLVASNDDDLDGIENEDGKKAVAAGNVGLDADMDVVPPLNLHLFATTDRRSTVLPSLLLEWPGRGRLDPKDAAELMESLRDCKEEDDENVEDEEKEKEKEEKDEDDAILATKNGDIEMNNSLFLRRKPCEDAAVPTTTASPKTNLYSNWDPANVSSYLDWDPWHSLTCEICGHENDACRMLICDDCHKGYHMYCCRPVIVSIPTNKWTCYKCNSSAGECAVGVRSFVDFAASINEQECCRFLKLPFQKLSKFHESHEEILKAFETPQNSRRKQLNLPKAKTIATVQHNSLHYSLRVERHDWVIPLPLTQSRPYVESTINIVAAMKYCGMTSYSEDLVYCEGVATEEMNNAALDSVEPLNKRNLEIFKHFKENLKNGAYPPITVEYDDRVGFSAVAVAGMAKHTLLMEYVGEVTTVRASEQSDSDSLMMLLDTGVPETSLIIDPSRTGNAARFLNGINNRSQFSRRKANVRTRRFVLNGKCRVALFTAKKVLPGDYLTYDYNAGIEGKEGEEWAKNGFYDTSFFF